MQTEPLVGRSDPGLLGGTPTFSDAGGAFPKVHLPCPLGGSLHLSEFQSHGFRVLSHTGHFSHAQPPHRDSAGVGIDGSAGQSCEDRGPDLTRSDWRPKGTCVLAEPGPTQVGRLGERHPGCLQRVMMQRATERSPPEPLPPTPAPRPGWGSREAALGREAGSEATGRQGWRVGAFWGTGTVQAAHTGADGAGREQASRGQEHSSCWPAGGAAGGGEWACCPVPSPARHRQARSLGLPAPRLPAGGKAVNTTPVPSQTPHDESDRRTEPRSSVSDLVNSLTSEMLMVRGRVGRGGARAEVGGRVGAVRAGRDPAWSPALLSRWPLVPQFPHLSSENMKAPRPPVSLWTEQGLRKATCVGGFQGPGGKASGQRTWAEGALPLSGSPVSRAPFPPSGAGLRSPSRDPPSLTPAGPAEVQRAEPRHGPGPDP